MLSEPKDAIAGLLELQQLFYHGVAGDFPGLYFRALYWCYTRGNRTELAQLIKILLFDKQSEVYAVNLLNTLPLTEFGSELQEVGTMQYAWLRSYPPCEVSSIPSNMHRHLKPKNKMFTP